MVMSEPSRLEQVAGMLMDAGVEFIIVGGQAEWLFGSPRVTYDIDLCYRRTAGNLERLASVLKRMKPQLRNAPPDLPFTIDARTLSNGENFTFVTEWGDFDLLGHLEPIGGYDELIKHAEHHQLGGRNVIVIALDDLIRIKRHINRPKDRESLYQLLAIKRIREEEKLGP
jgi:predicted nucleotidyltransferase